MSISGIGSALGPPSSAAAAGGSKPSGVGGPKSPEEDFLEFARMSPAERMRAAILKEMGITEEDLAKMGPEERAEVSKEVAERIRDKALHSREKQSGMIVDVSA
jgi:hypothetical protein